MKIIQNYIQRYFIHRTGVRPTDCVNIYLEQELNKAMSNRKFCLYDQIIRIFSDQRSNFESLEDIYLV